ncbi:MAG: ATP-binding protein [Romboutsia sp.]|uniref:sensor histidine kinase n=1 Tax=Romboutsia sp. TaxID=1965302 RepID=UPI003F376CF9
MRNSLIRKIFILVIFCLVSVFVQPKNINAQSDNSRFNVLVLNSYHQGHYWESNILHGLNKSIKANDEKDINLKLEYLDFRNKNDEQYIQSLKEMLSVKYPKGSIDAIYTVDDEAYEAFRDETLNEKSSFYKIPLVFSGVDNKLDGTKEEKKYMTGIYHGDDSMDLFSLITRLNPKTDTVNLIIENSLYCDSVKAEIDNLINGYLKKRIDIRYVRSDYIEDILVKLDNLEYRPNAVNIIAGEFQYKDSLKYVDPKKIIEKIKDHSDAPIYSNDQTYLNAGILGGHIDIGQEHASIVLDMLIKIKNGVNIESIENDIEPKAKAYIDYNSVYEYDIDTFNINKEDNIINRKPYQLLAPTWVKLSISMLICIVFIAFILFLCLFINHKKEMKDREKEKEREKLKTDFIVNLSHELRTPINIILGTSKILELNIKNKNLNPIDYINKLENINQNSYRLLKISNNIIDITKAESGMFELQIKNCNIVEVIEEIFISSIDFAKRKDINMTFDTEVEEIITAIDIFQIQRVVLNLLSNAIKFTDKGGCIFLKISTDYKNIIIEVKDNGIGIPKEKINYIFHRFYQVDNLMTRKSEGSGIGLCVVKEILEIHGGKIEIESELTKGSNFKVHIPIKIIEDENKDINSRDLDINNIVDLEMSDI